MALKRKVKDIMTSRPRTIAASADASEATNVLVSSPFNGLPVIGETGDLVGIITLGDLIRRGGLYLKLGFVEEPQGKKVSHVMTCAPVTVDQEDSVASVIEMMLERKLKRFPVTDAKGKLTGMLSRVDVFAAVSGKAHNALALLDKSREQERLRYVSDIMRTDTPKIPLSTLVSEIIGTVDANDIQRVVVVDRHGKFFGVISDKDILPALLEKRFLSFRRFFDVPALFGLTPPEGWMSDKAASEMMNGEVMTVHAAASAEEGINLMMRSGLKRIPVVDDAGKFCGMLSRDFLFRAWGSSLRVLAAA